MNSIYDYETDLCMCFVLCASDVSKLRCSILTILTKNLNLTITPTIITTLLLLLLLHMHEF